jgi:hypothetical protein
MFRIEYFMHDDHGFLDRKLMETMNRPDFDLKASEIYKAAIL